MSFPPLPPVSPIPPREGEFERMRRRAYVRRLRIPAAAVASGALVAVALASVSSPQATGRIEQVTDEPTQAEQTYEPTPFPTTSPSPIPTPAELSPTPSRAATLEPTAEPTIEPTPTTSPAPDPVCGPGGVRRTSGPYVSGVVVNAAGTPLAGITITAEACRDGITYDGTTADVTDSAGRFQFPCAHDHWAVAAPYEWYSGKRSTSLDVGYRWFNGSFGSVKCGSSDHRIVLPAGASVRGQLVDAAGNPVLREGEQVGIMAEADEVTPLASPTTDANGQIFFDGLAPGRYFLYAQNAYAWFTVTEGGHADVNVKEKAPPSPSASASESLAAE